MDGCVDDAQCCPLKIHQTMAQAPRKTAAHMSQVAQLPVSPLQITLTVISLAPKKRLKVAQFRGLAEVLATLMMPLMMTGYSHRHQLSYGTSSSRKQSSSSLTIDQERGPLDCAYLLW